MSIAHGMCPAHMMKTNSSMREIVLPVRTANFDALECCFGDASPPMM
jgi:hypothetical protein